MPRQLITTADDFGASLKVNDAVEAQKRLEFKPEEFKA